MTLRFLKDQHDSDEAQEAADYVRDALAARGADVTMQWAAEEAVLDAFGFEKNDDDDIVRKT